MAEDREQTIRVTHGAAACTMRVEGLEEEEKEEKEEGMVVAMAMDARVSTGSEDDQPLHLLFCGIFFCKNQKQENEDMDIMMCAPEYASFSALKASVRMDLPEDKEGEGEDVGRRYQVLPMAADGRHRLRYAKEQDRDDELQKVRKRLRAPGITE